MIAGICALTLIGGSTISAYFTDSEDKTNVMTVGKVSINLYEPKWDGEEENGPDVDRAPENPELGINKGKDIYPLKEIPKDPTIKNTGINPSWVYMEIKIPKAQVVTANVDGTRNASKMTELFSYDIDQNWKDITSNQVKKENESSKDYNTYVYAYKSPLAGSKSLVDGSNSIYNGEKSTALFQKITFVNVIEGQGLEEKQLTIPIRALAIQSDNTGTAEEAYKKYINQNKDGAMSASDDAMTESTSMPAGEN